jgi:hypothetical protein
MFGATSTAESAATCLSAVLHAELDGEGTLHPAEAIASGTRRARERTATSRFDERFHALVGTIIDRGRADAEKRVALLLCRYTGDVDACAPHDGDYIAVWVLAPTDLPKFENLISFARELIHRSPAVTPIPGTMPPHVFAVEEFAHRRFPQASPTCFCRFLPNRLDHA